MTNFIDFEGHFDKTGKKIIGTSSPQVVNGDVAKAMWLLNADQYQADLLHFGPSFCSVGGYTGAHFGPAASVVNSVVAFLAPAFCDVVAVGVLVKGSGTVTLNSNYSITVTNELGGYFWRWGSLTENLIPVGATSAGVPAFKTITYSKEAGVDIISMVIRFARTTQNIT